MKTRFGTIRKCAVRLSVTRRRNRSVNVDGLTNQALTTEQVHTLEEQTNDMKGAETGPKQTETHGDQRISASGVYNSRAA